MHGFIFHVPFLFVKISLFPTYLISVHTTVGSNQALLLTKTHSMSGDIQYSTTALGPNHQLGSIRIVHVRFILIVYYRLCSHSTQW